MRLFTIGYEHTPQAAVIDCLERAGVRVVIDVRAVASSRRAGFSKTVLAASLRDAGIDYVHLRGLGTPKTGRQAAHAGKIEVMRRIYEGHLAEPEAQAQLEQAIDIAKERPAALLCYEAEAANCHRRIVAQRMTLAAPFETVDLTP
jgi:uncharacterized protein (DUF488 family)